VKLGLLSDIHEHVEHLQAALAVLRQERVEKIVVLGDLVELCQRLPETCALLAGARAVGVWGNHDFGLCHEPSAELVAKYPTVVTSYFASLQPRLVLEGCHFSHIEPWLDPYDLCDLWSFSGPPDDPAKLARLFGSRSERILFAGHYHRWLLATPTGIANWRGESPITLDSSRSFVTLGALCCGEFATFDTTTSELVPYRARGNEVENA
jgi:hypothetical protein